MEEIHNMSADKKIKLILNLFKAYQPMLSVVEQVALLTMWIESCIESEEYEMAGALTKQLKNIQENPNTVSQRLEGDLDNEAMLENNPLLKKIENKKEEVITTEEIDKMLKEEFKKPSIYRRIINWFKRLFSK